MTCRLRHQHQVLGDVSKSIWKFFRELLTIWVSVGLDVPVGIDITGVILLITSNLDLLETPLWQVDVTSAKVAAENCMLESESGGQSSNFSSVIG